MASVMEKDTAVISRGMSDKEDPRVEDHEPTSQPAGTHLLGEQSPGVRRVQIIAQHFTLPNRILFFFGIFLIAYAYGLDGTLRTTFQAYATESYSNHSLLATIGVLRGVVAAAAQPTAAKIADVFGRVEVVILTVVFYVIGTIVEVFAKNVQAFAAGSVLYQIGYTGILLLVEVLVADVTSLRTRLIFSYIPATPFIINTWVSGDILQAIVDNSSWQWGIGMWAIIYPVCALPLIGSLYIAHRRAKKAGALEDYKTPYELYGPRRVASAVFWQLDTIGAVLLVAVFALILVPLTIAGGVHQQWKTAKIIAPLVIGILLIPVWVVWEMKCQHPMVPFKLLKDRAVWGALGLALMLNCAWYLQGNYLYTVLVVAFDESEKSATRITQVYSFTSVITGCIVGLLVIKIRRLKSFIVFGTVVFLVAFGLLIHYRGGTSSGSHSGIIGAQVLLGIAGGLFPYPAQASIQAATKHEHVAVITGLYLATYSIGSALGNTISGALWSQLLPSMLADKVDDPSAVSSIYAQPFVFAAEYPVGTPVRDAAIVAYQQIQRILCITGICLSVLLIAFSVVLRDPVLGKEQSLPNAEKDSDDSSVDTRVV